MKKFKNTRQTLAQVYAIAEMDVTQAIRYKYKLLFLYISPLVSIIMPVIVLGNFFQYNVQFGPWTIQNFLIFQLVAYNIMITKDYLRVYAKRFQSEKIWNTLSGLIIAPFSRYSLLFGIYLSKLILIAIPFTVFFIISWFFYPISGSTIIFVIFLYLLISIVFSGIGMILGAFAISNEGVWRALAFILDLFFWFSCLTYPIQIFPEAFQVIINANPLFYLFDFLRLSWLDNNVMFSLINYPIHLIFLVASAIFLIMFGVYSFNLVYKKYGIVGY